MLNGDAPSGHVPLGRHVPATVRFCTATPKLFEVLSGVRGAFKSHKGFHLLGLYAEPLCRHGSGVCRNIRVLHDFEPPTTDDEIRAAALQYVRKVTGMLRPARSAEAAFEHAVVEVARATTKLLAALPPRAEHRTREGERKKARMRWTSRVERGA